jgi:hypothetical protein
VAKLLKQQKTVTFSNLYAFFNALSHAPELHVQHTRPLQSWPEFAVYVFVLAVGSIYKIMFNPFTTSCENALSLSVPGDPAPFEKFPHSNQLIEF